MTLNGRCDTVSQGARGIRARNTAGGAAHQDLRCEADEKIRTLVLILGEFAKADSANVSERERQVSDSANDDEWPR